jgi:hypothetical protein
MIRGGLKDLYSHRRRCPYIKDEQLKHPTETGHPDLRFPHPPTARVASGGQGTSGSSADDQGSIYHFRNRLLPRELEKLFSYVQCIDIFESK